MTHNAGRRRVTRADLDRADAYRPAAVSPAQALRTVSARLSRRQPEIEEALFARVCAVSDDEVSVDDEYLLGRRAAIAALLTFAVSAIADGDEPLVPLPSEPLIQTQRAARQGVPLETILRRYYAAHQLLSEFVIEESNDLSTERLRHVTRILGSLLESTIDRITHEYRSVIERANESPQQFLTIRVERLLAGRPVDLSKFEYDFDASHVAVIASGPRATRLIARSKARFGCSLLSATPDDGTVWLWLAGTPPSSGDIDRLLDTDQTPEVTLAIGGSARGVAGWRLSHSQAQDALRVAQLAGHRLTRYTDVALVAPWLHNPPRAHFLIEFYLSSLLPRGNGDTMLCNTLQAYFDSGRNATAAANTLKIARRTMYKRLERIESRLGELIRTHQAELELALRLHNLLDAPSGV